MASVTLPQRRTPILIEPAVTTNIAEFAQENSAMLQERMLEAGALLLRGFAVRSVEDFDSFVTVVTSKRMDYVYGSTPRTALGNRIFSATEYPAAQEIPLHTENSYQRSWPLKLALCCLRPAASGGETPIADLRRVSAALGAGLMDKFERLGVRYVRHYRPFVDVPWQQVFRTDNRLDVSRYCAEHDIQHEWLDEQTLRTCQIAQGVARHPVTGERVFFNQADLFHVSNLGTDAATALLELYGEYLPRNSYYGDGQEILVDELATVRSVLKSAVVVFSWQAGDILLLDNMQFAHGRRPFKGERKVVVALMEPHVTP
jgi:alpha-ketoglutarate-dependent taurine dioxygenase